MDPADAGSEFDLEIEPVSMNYDPYDHSTMPSMRDTILYNKVPNVELVREQEPSAPISRMYGYGTKPVAESIPVEILDDKLALFKYMYDNPDHGESIIDLYVKATNIRKKKIYPGWPKGHSHDQYYKEITKPDFYWYLAHLSFHSGWRGKRVSQRDFHKTLQNDSRFKPYKLMPMRRFEVIHNSLDIGENKQVDLLINGQPKLSRRTGRPIQVLDLKVKYEKPFEKLNIQSHRWHVSDTGVYSIDERLSKSFMKGPTQGNRNFFEFERRRVKSHLRVEVQKILLVILFSSPSVSNDTNFGQY